MCTVLAIHSLTNEPIGRKVTGAAIPPLDREPSVKAIDERGDTSSAGGHISRTEAARRSSLT
jgi:hypothetical protein